MTSAPSQYSGFDHDRRVRRGLTTIPATDKRTAGAKLRAITREQQANLRALGLRAPDAHLVARTVRVTATQWQAIR